MVRRLVLTALGLWAGAVLIWLGLAYRDLEAGVQAVERAEQASSPSDVLEGTPGAELERARGRFASAHQRADGLLLWPVRHLPVVGRQLRSVTALSAAARDVSDTGADALAAAQTLLDDDFDGAERVELLRSLHQVVTEAGGRLASVDLGTDVALVAPLAERRTELSERLSEVRDSLDRASRLTQEIADLLEGPSRYLLLAGNNAEMRAGSATFTSAGIVEIANGELSLGDMESTALLQLPEGPPITDPDLAANWGEVQPNREWRNLALTPRFDATAELAAAMWRARTGEQVDGVLAMDVEALRAILAATGEVRVGELVAGADNVVDLVMHDQYVQFDDPLEQIERHDRLGLIAGATVGAIERGDYDLHVLADELTQAAQGRHVLLWSADEEAQAAWEAGSLAGTLGEESLMVALLNRGGNKLDRFIDITHRLSMAEADDGTVEVAIEVTIRNNVGEDEPPYVAGPHPLTDLAEGEYGGILAFSLPAAAGEYAFDGDPPPLSLAGDDGTNRVIGTRVRIIRGDSRTLTLRFGMPAGVEMRLEPSARLPAPIWRSEDEEWNDAVPRTIPLLAERYE